MMRRLAFNLVPWMLCLTLVIGTGSAGVALGQDKKDTEDAASKTDKDSAVITNDDLERMFSEPQAAPADALELPAEEKKPALRTATPANPGDKPAPQASDPLKWMQDRQARQAEWERQVAEAEQEVTDAEQKVTDLEYRLRATRIPFLARPEIPQDEESEWAGLSASERAALTQQQLDTARDELATARQKLSSLRSQRP